MFITILHTLRDGRLTVLLRLKPSAEDPPWSAHITNEKIKACMYMCTVQGAKQVCKRPSEFLSPHYKLFSQRPKLLPLFCASFFFFVRFFLSLILSEEVVAGTDIQLLLLRRHVLFRVLVVRIMSYPNSFVSSQCKLLAFVNLADSRRGLGLIDDQDHRCRK